MRAVIGVEIDAADRAAADRAMRDELVHDVLGEIARHGEPDALIAAGLAEDRRVDPDELSTRVDQRAAGISLIDRGVGLNEVLVHACLPGCARRADDAEGDGLIEDAERIADGEHPLGHLQLRRIAPRQHRQVPARRSSARQGPSPRRCRRSSRAARACRAA